MLKEAEDDLNTQAGSSMSRPYPEPNPHNAGAIQLDAEESLPTPEIKLPGPEVPETPQGISDDIEFSQGDSTPDGWIYDVEGETWEKGKVYRTYVVKLKVKDDFVENLGETGVLHIALKQTHFLAAVGNFVERNEKRIFVITNTS
ncbi:uncharacterized protein PV07_12731, partial [Cladophialophora immunda]